MRMEDLNIRVKGGKIHLELFPSAKACQLNHYIKLKLEDYKYVSMYVRLFMSV